MSRWIRTLTHLAAVLVGVGIGVAAAGPLFDRFAPEPMRVRTVSVLGNERLSAQQVADAAALHPDESLRTVDLDAVRERVIHHPWIQGARVAALPPDRVLIAVAERRPAAVARFGSSDRRFVDATGVPFAPAPDVAAGPELAGVDEADPDAPHPLLAQGVALLAAWRQRGLAEPRAVTLAGASASQLPAVTDARGRRVVLGGGGLETKLARLGRLEAADPEPARTADEIDLRFGGQVILRSGPSPDGDEATQGRGDAAASEPGGTARPAPQQGGE